MNGHAFDCGKDDCAMCQDKAKELLERRFTTTNQEAETNCRGCGYNTTDEERYYYGLYGKDEEGKVIKKYHFCVFCVDHHYSRLPLFKNIMQKIHFLKMKLRDKWRDRKSVV